MEQGPESRILIPTSKTCIPVPVGIDSDADAAGNLGAGFPPHAVLQHRNAQKGENLGAGTKTAPHPWGIDPSHDPKSISDCQDGPMVKNQMYLLKLGIYRRLDK